MWNGHHQPHPPTTMIPKRSPTRSRSSYRNRLMRLVIGVEVYRGVVELKVLVEAPRRGGGQRQQRGGHRGPHARAHLRSELSECSPLRVPLAGILPSRPPRRLAFAPPACAPIPFLPTRCDTLRGLFCLTTAILKNVVSYIGYPEIFL